MAKPVTNVRGSEGIQHHGRALTNDFELSINTQEKVCAERGKRGNKKRVPSLMRTTDKLVPQAF